MSERTDRKAQRRDRFIRWGVLSAVLVTITVITIAHGLGGAPKPVGVDALCPFGGIETLFSVLAGNGFLKRTAASALILLVGTLALTVMLRRSFCGQICPLGALQGFFGTIGRKVHRTKIELPAAFDRPARLLKYAVLIFFAVWTWQAADLVMRPYDPWAAYAHITSAELFTDFGVGALILGVSLAGSVIYERFFCKYLCPMGAFLGLLSRFSFLRIERDADTCIDCGKCDSACPMNIEVAVATEVRDSECISCSECVNACPAAGALELKTPKRGRVSALAATALAVAVFTAIIGATSLSGTFAWGMPTLEQSVEQQGGSTGAAFDTELIKGSTSMGEISRVTGLAPERFTAQWGVPASDLDKPMKDIKDTYGFSPGEVRAWVAAELGQ